MPPPRGTDQVLGTNSAYALAIGHEAHVLGRLVESAFTLLPCYLAIAIGVGTDEKLFGEEDELLNVAGGVISSRSG